MISDHPLVSVIIPNYNYAEFVGSAVQSALTQTYRNVEVIVVDNYSTDNSLQILSEIRDPRLRVLQFNNGGVIAAGRNFGVKNARGEVLAFLDSDDRWFPRKLELQLEHLARPEVKGVASDFVAVGDTLYHKHHVFFQPGTDYRDYTYSDIARLNSIMTSSIMVRTRDFHEAGGFDEGTAFRFIEDWDLWLRLAHCGTMRVLNSKLIEYRIVRKKERDMRIVSLSTLRVLQKHEQLGLINGVALQTAYGSCYLLIARACLDRDDWQGVKYYRRGLVLTHGVRNKLRAIAGISLFLMPSFLRKIFLDAYYHMPVGNPS